jgi:hypothetical protein
MTPEEQFKNLVDKGDTEGMKTFLSEKATMANGFFSDAVERGDFRAAGALLAAGFSPWSLHETKIKVVEKGDRAMVRAFMTQGVNFFKTDHYSASKEYFIKLQMILSALQAEDIVNALTDLKKEIALITRPQQLDKPLPVSKAAPSPGNLPPSP